MAKKQFVLVLTEPTEGREDEFNRYYEDVHLDEVLETTGWKSAQRFQLVDQKGKDCPLPYLAFYETEVNEDKSAIKIMDERRRDREQSGSLNKKTAAVWVFEETGPEHTR
jgi:hypothetical protein